MTKLVFTSCMDPMDSPKQRVWDAIAARRPEHVLLLGDNIYMDYAFSKNPANGKPSRFTLQVFAEAMYGRYARQWAILRASALYGLPGLAFHGVWDDHDFAWNGSYGDNASNAEADVSDSDAPVSQRKQGISRRLMRDFFAALNGRASVYPAFPFQNGDYRLQEDLSQPMYCSANGQQRITLAAGVHLYLADGRSFRTGGRAARTTALGGAQLAAIGQALASGDVLVLASGSTLTRGESLNDYGDYKRLLQMAEDTQGRLLALTGDIHKRNLRTHALQRPRDKQATGTARSVFEATASGAARSKLTGGVGIYGELEVGADVLRVQLFDDAREPRKALIRRDLWMRVD